MKTSRFLLKKESETEMKIDNERVGKAIARLRVMRGLTQQQLNQQIGMKTVQHIEQGRNKPSLETLNKIADALDIPAACIVLMGSTIDPADRVLSSLNSLLETTLSLEVEQPGTTKSDKKTQPKSGVRKTSGRSGSKASSKSKTSSKGAAGTRKPKREKTLA